MSVMDKKRAHAEVVPDGCDKLRRPCDDPSSTGQEHLEQEKRVRREIANSNERRRMQSINAGFDSLRILLPPMQDGEKMSKATILQLTADYINSLLNRVSLLENEVAIYRQSSGIQPSTVVPDFTVDIGLSKKRKPDEQKKRSTCIRSRRRRIDTVNNYDLSRSCAPNYSPNADARQTSPSNSFNSSISASPPSPLPDGTTNPSARLEHLVMAIEQIEGGRVLHCSGNESPNESLSTGAQSPLSSDPYWQSPNFIYPDGQSSTFKPNAPFTDVLMLTPVSNIAAVPVSLCEANFHNPESTDYPAVTKPNRPIPHKYLHRPQVVVNSSH